MYLSSEKNTERKSYSRAGLAFPHGTPGISARDPWHFRTG
jgi:hypothetical protein